MATSTRFSGAGARRQGYREGGDAPECTCAELAHPQGARRQALFRRLSDPVRRDILPLRVRRRQQAKAGAGAACWCAAAVLPADLCGCGARAEADPPAAVGAIPLPQLRRSLPFPPRCLSVRCCLRSASRPADFFAAGVRGSRLSRGQRRAVEAAAVGTAAPVPLCNAASPSCFWCWSCCLAQMCCLAQISPWCPSALTSLPLHAAALSQFADSGVLHTSVGVRPPAEIRGPPLCIACVLSHCLLPAAGVDQQQR